MGGILIKHFLAGQAGSRYSEPQRTVHIPLLEGIPLYQRVPEIRALLCTMGRQITCLVHQAFVGMALTLTGFDVWTGQRDAGLACRRQMR